MRSILLPLFLILSTSAVLQAAEVVTPSSERPRVIVSPEDTGPLRSNYVVNNLYYSHAYRYNHYYSAYGPVYFYGNYTPIGKTSVWATVGSNDYMGTGFTTVQKIPETNLVYSVTAAWESGKSWYGNIDYTNSTIAPSLHWSNGRTSTYIGATISQSNSDFGDFEHLGLNAGISHRVSDYLSLAFHLNDFENSFKQ